MMKEINSEAIYATIGVLLEVLGHSKSSISEIMNTISSNTSSKSTKKSAKKSKAWSKPKKGQYLDSILSVMLSNPEKAFTVDEISSSTGVPVATVRTYIKQLRASHKVKLVDWSMLNKGPATLMYQSYRNSMKALKTVSQEEGYDSVYNFVKNNKSLFKGVMPSSFALVVEQEGLTVYPLLLGIGVVKGYKVSDLKKLATKVYRINNDTIKPKRKCTRKTTQAKRKCTRKTQVQPVAEVQASSNKGFGLVEKLFRINKKKNSDLIKF